MELVTEICQRTGKREREKKPTSSRRSTFALLSMARIMRSFIFQPPDRLLRGLDSISSVKLMFLRAVVASSLVTFASSLSLPASNSSISGTPWSSEASSCCT